MKDINTFTRQNIEDLVSSIITSGTHNELVSWEEISRVKELSWNFIRRFKDKISWEDLCEVKDFPSYIIEEFIDKVDWEGIAWNSNLSVATMEKYFDKLNPTTLLINQKLPEQFIVDHSDIFFTKLERLFTFQKVSETFIRNIIPLLSINIWRIISYHQDLSAEFIEEFSEYVDIDNICCYQQNVSADFIIKHLNDISIDDLIETRELPESLIDRISRSCLCDFNWDQVVMHQQLSEDFIRDHHSQFLSLWNKISEYQVLSEDFIREFKRYVNWNYISTYQTISEEFIEEFSDHINWRILRPNKKVSEDFIIRHENDINLNNFVKTNSFTINLLRRYADRIDIETAFGSHREFITAKNIDEFRSRISSVNYCRFHMPECIVDKFKYEKCNWGIMISNSQISMKFILNNINNESFKYIDMAHDILTRSKFTKDELMKYLSYFKEQDIKTVISAVLRNRNFDTLEDRKHEVAESILGFELHDEYFIAYKGINKNHTDNYSGEILYKEGKTYEEPLSDYSSLSCERGLHFVATPKQIDALDIFSNDNYCIAKLKICYEDVIHISRTKGRARKYEILSIDNNYINRKIP